MEKKKEKKRRKENEEEKRTRPNRLACLVQHTKPMFVRQNKDTLLNVEYTSFVQLD